MATKAKESNVVGKEKKAPSSNSPITSTKRTLKPSSSTDKSTTTNPSGKPIPNYLKPTLSSRLESNSFKLPKSDASNKPTLNRRRSFDKPQSPSVVTKQKEPSPSRQHKALVSPGPKDRSLPTRTSSVPLKSTSKPISERTSKTPKEGKTHPLVAKSTTKSSLSHSTSTTKKVANYASANSSSNAEKSIAETTEALNVESEPEVKEAINEQVVKVEKQEEIENVSEVPPHVESEHEHEHEHDHDHQIEEFDHEPLIQPVDKVIPTVSEEAALIEEPQEEKINDELEENDNANQDECNVNESHHETNHSTNEQEVDEVKEKEEEGGVIIEEDHKSEINNEEEAVEEKEGVEGEESEVVELTEGQGEHEHVESTEVKEDKAESTKPKEQAASVVQGKKESQVSNDMIEETAGKLLEARKNRVRALAGAFQTVIDHQTK